MIHKGKSRFLFSATAHRDFEIFKKAVLDFCGVQSLAEGKGLGRCMDCLFMRTVRSGTVPESFCIHDSILQGILTLALNYLSLHYKFCPLTARCQSF